MPGRDTREIKTKIHLPDTDIPPPMQPAEERRQNPRSFSIELADLTMHGFTKGCLGCNAIRNQKTKKEHNRECKMQFQQLVADIGDKRMGKEEERLQRCMIQQDDKENKTRDDDAQKYTFQDRMNHKHEKKGEEEDEQHKDLEDQLNKEADLFWDP